MTPLEFARRECANWQGGNYCLGMEKTCLLAGKPIKPCDYFERCVMNLPDQPGADKHPNYFGYIEAREKYLKLRKKEIPQVKISTCRHCGEPVAKRYRYCSPCAKKRRREKQRELMRKRR